MFLVFFEINFSGIFRFFRQNAGTQETWACSSHTHWETIFSARMPYPPGRIVDQNMGHRPHQLAVLKDRTAAHPLDNSSSGFQKPGVGDLHHQVQVSPAAAGKRE